MIKYVSTIWSYDNKIFGHMVIWICLISYDHWLNINHLITTKLFIVKVYWDDDNLFVHPEWQLRQQCPEIWQTPVLVTWSICWKISGSNLAPSSASMSRWGQVICSAASSWSVWDGHLGHHGHYGHHGHFGHHGLHPAGPSETQKPSILQWFASKEKDPARKDKWY